MDGQNKCTIPLLFKKGKLNDLFLMAIYLMSISYLFIAGIHFILINLKFKSAIFYLEENMVFVFYGKSQNSLI